MKQRWWLRSRLWRLRRKVGVDRLVAFLEDKWAFKSRGEISEKAEELEERWNYGLSSLEAKTGRDHGDERVLARARRERLEQRYDDLISAPDRHDSFDEWIAWGQLEGQLQALNWALGWKWDRPLEEWWSDFDSGFLDPI